MAEETSLSLSAVSAGYGGRVVLNDVSIKAPRGKVTAIIGANGSGKSTVLRAVVGLCDVVNGTIVIGDRTVDIHAAVDWRVREFGIAVLPQKRSLFDDLTVEENLVVSTRSLPTKERSQSMQKAIGTFERIAELRKRLTENLSGGERQMVALAGVLACRPRVLLLDEPSAGLSPELIGSIFERVSLFARQTQSIVVVVEHSLRQLRELADIVYILRRGVISYSGSPSVLDDEEQLAQYFI